MVPVRDPEPSCPGRPGRRTSRSPEPRRIPFLAISIALVAIMAGSALFLSGYSMGRQAAAEPGTPPSESEAFQPFWDTYHAIGDRYAGGDVDRTTGRPGRHPGDDQRAGRPVLGLPDLRRVPRQPARDQRPVRGDRRRDRRRRRRTARRAARRSAAACRLVVTKPLEGSPAEKAGVDDRRHRGLGRWHGARRPDGRCRAGPDPRPEGIGRQARRPARARRTDPADDHP